MPVLLEEVPFFRELSDKDFSSIKKRLAEKTLAKGEALFIEGNACAGIFFVKSGWIKCIAPPLPERCRALKFSAQERPAPAILEPVTGPAL
ncbi:MAG: hypothetical protein A3C54_05510 [Deltaproteobacteria bacterium RIFCSPHIGHO2_02_FULL_60_17]|nr:MAG: hypothetical protein A3C54_05510 [Deltaproteobacteria bacterium RIFCSPHIGHO2_02_FULL_60_17]